jgi:hypothetical protein
MRMPVSFLTVILSTAAFAQFQGTFGNVVFPAGTNAMPGVTRFFPNVVFPAGNAPHLVPSAQVAFNRGFVGGQGAYGYAGYGSRRYGGAVAVPYAVPVYVGGYAGYTGYYDSGAPPDTGAAAAAGPAQPNVIVVYPSVAPGATPPPPFGAYGEAPGVPPPTPGASPAGPSAQGGSSVPQAPTYLIAFKDHTIYSAVAYWVEGDTLHYFTTGATHNQVSLSLVDRDLTLRLNQEAGTNMQLPNN